MLYSWIKPKQSQRHESHQEKKHPFQILVDLQLKIILRLWRLADDKKDPNSSHDTAQEVITSEKPM